MKTFEKLKKEEPTNEGLENEKELRNEEGIIKNQRRIEEYLIKNG